VQVPKRKGVRHHAKGGAQSHPGCHACQAIDGLLRRGALVTLSQKHGSGSLFCPHAALSALRCECLVASLDLVRSGIVFCSNTVSRFCRRLQPSPAQAPLPYQQNTSPSPPRSHGPEGLLISTTRSGRLACPGRAGCSWWNFFQLSMKMQGAHLHGGHSHLHKRHGDWSGGNNIFSGTPPPPPYGRRRRRVSRRRRATTSPVYKLDGQRK